MIRPATTFGRYTLLERIAEGGMGEVWKAQADAGLGLGKIVALKRVAERFGEDADFVAMFIEEARISLALSHPNIVQVFDAGREAGRLFLAMEHVEGRNLHDVIHTYRAKKHELLPERFVLTVATAVARGLEHAHRRRGPDGRRLGIVHRDVSPGNILCAYEGDVKLVDFGLAKATVRAYQSMFGTIKGKAAYMAPEQARGEPVDARADVFGLGAVLYEMLAGQGPYARAGSEGETLAAARRGQWHPIALARPGLPAELVAIVEKALAREAAERFATADELGQALEDHAARTGQILSAASFGSFLVDLFAVSSRTLPPHPFARALGAGLGLGATGPSWPAAAGEDQKRATAPTAVLEPPPPPPTPLAVPAASDTDIVGRRRPVLWIVMVVLAVGVAIGAVMARRSRSEAPMPTLAATTPVAPSPVAPNPIAPSPTPTLAARPERPSPRRKPPVLAQARTTEPSAPTAPNVAAIEAEAVVSFGSDPWSEVSVDGRALCRAPVGCKRLRLRAGTHHVRFVNAAARLCKDVPAAHFQPGENPPLTVDLEPCP